MLSDMTFKREETVSEALEALILGGFAEVAGVDAEGELLYGLTEHGTQVSAALKELYESGEVDFDN